MAKPSVSDCGDASLAGAEQPSSPAAPRVSAFEGSGIATVGGEAPVEQNPDEKFCVEKSVLLCESVLWDMLENYYKQMAITAWAQDYVPSFVTSNSRLCRSYARVIFNFIQDLSAMQQQEGARDRKHGEADSLSSRVVIVEIGGGHGRFTYLLLRALLRYRHLFRDLGLPEKPFLYVFSDVAEANVTFCSKHPAFQSFIADGWLDFAVFDGNDKEARIHLTCSKQTVPLGTPIVAVANYVFDSLLTDGWRVTPGENVEFHRAAVSVYSPQVEPDPTAADIMLRMSLGWDWLPVNLDEACRPVEAEGKAQPGGARRSAYLREDPTIRQVLTKYRELNKTLSFVLPVGAFSLFRNLLRLSGNRLFCLIGDKGYPTADEFVGERDPHIAIHGSISFMLNLHAVRLYFDALGGFSQATPYRDTFQVTGLWLCGQESDMPRSRAAFLDDLEDMAPDSLIQWQRSCQDLVSSGGDTGVKIKELISLLRYSGHDADVLLNFSSAFTSQCVQPFISLRTEQDILFDLDQVYKNWYKLKKGEDVADLCAHICMRLGRCDAAVKYLQGSIDACPEGLHSATFVNLASCHKVLGNIEEGIACCEKALELQPDYAQAKEMLMTLKICQNPVTVALVGLGYWTKYEAIHLLRRDRRIKIAAVYGFKQSEAEAFESCLGLDNISVYWGSAGLKDLLQREEIQAVVLDVHGELMPSFLPKVFESGKHVLSRSPLGLRVETGWKLIEAYKPFASRLVWHAVDSARTEEAFYEARRAIAELGNVTTITVHCATDLFISAPTKASDGSPCFPYDVKDHLALELLRCISAIRTITGEQLVGVASFFGGDSQLPARAEAGEKEENGGEREADSQKKATRLRRDAPRLTGWLQFTGTHCSEYPEIPATFMLTNSAGDNSLKYTICCARGTLEISKSMSAWQLKTITDGCSTSQAVQSIGHQNSHDAWLMDLYPFLYEKKATHSSYEEDQPLVDVTVNAALSDCATMDAILTSIQKGGFPVRFAVKKVGTDKVGKHVTAALETAA
ncbi:putative TPR domain-containing protein [Neospora caninum Liverpool]|uniref:Putative TPR domain-containing protein n=1 Tax=Neospora caninum (strain Liverpool) TaxID=572307 RepID=F0VJQ5_NEOCL|nr:putative TPR domain-containing protein [Neospora caninum Liverpool]CBZ53966.1 putative TPR domain-containing protein [Neospora caninum Liverpool]CEL67967.1 TPA: TPR domain-containing protein, putative [Neospora caninum Liverpool]|eukprot:XP_003883998.1 putative TPR domain-containing protein [Neospora caninum Liverpool]